MVAPHRLARQGDILRAVGGGARRAGVERDAPRGRHVALAREHATDVGLEALVVEHGHGGGEGLGRMHAVEAEGAAESRPPPALESEAQHALLHLGGVASQAVDGPHALREPGPE